MSIRGGLSRLFRTRRGGREPSWPTPDDPELTVVVEATDETESASTVLTRSPAWIPESPAVLRYRLVIGSAAVAELRQPLEAEGWLLRTETTSPGSDDAPASDSLILVAQCVRRIDAMTCARETSRMVGLAQRHGGHLAGWQALQRPSESDRSR
ncbi:hypothetical protein SAMN04487820_107244 [Actinopolyspora mzabensis]|uniref:Uncharacterized protein n=1 Tax=Actinopolyspora mzabensis TaxID=995066 RepID=A0A1G9BMJ1_ACTMZ|nr:hypothetical protein [Actinopolyspora mzabensis]SDK40706.1 hypothetical protein SAMN04487820_107244 [Actinopolyspora mzabensis]